ncbi:motility associated factor glycosyltransferase family protein [Paenibacillus lycopersici]|uniref:Motility associated factor glycosyltransferase family protein n=1 Tax=Paenibacillus lycopersici TaxID=2704462 RepID=A0A6C0G4C0_9BACL|nr:6-hydroxymethylpterin diphosphokinase MptE-like protein [Paenibacillus lycopersici]QHT63442.1 motility associated factor glycosyltransferase family protein [Paenibacillus lycopersici]
MQFKELLQGLNDLYTAANSLGRQLADRPEDTLLHKAITNFAERLSLSFTELNRLMDEEDYVQAADWMKYELAELIYSLAIKLGGESDLVERRFQANLTYLERRFPHVYERLQSLQPDRAQYQLTYASNASPNLYLRRSDGTMMYLYSNYEPEHEARRWVESMKDTFAGKTNAIVYGFGFGYHVLQLARKFPKLKLTIYEPDEQVLLAAMQAVDLEPLFQELHVELLVVNWDKANRHKLFMYIAKYLKGETALAALPAYDKADPQRKRAFFKDAVTAIQHLEMSERSSAYYGIQLFQNRLYNLSYLLQTPSIQGLRDKMKGHTAVIVGSGPSLEKDIGHLRQIRNHACIIAAGTAAQALLHAGITPHLVVSVDYGESNGVAFQHLDLDHVPFLYAPQLKYTIMDGKHKPVFFLMENDHTSKYILGIEEDDTLIASSTPTVTGPAIQAAIYMGFEQIVFTGQDMSFPGDRVYAAGVMHETDEVSKMKISSSELAVENVQGGMNRTSPLMQVTRGEIEKLLGEYPNIRFVNASRLGAKIEHTTYRPLEAVLQQLKEVRIPSDPLCEIMEACLQPFDEDRKSAILGRLLDFPRQIGFIEATLIRIKQQLDSLQELSGTDPHECHHAMVDIEEMWGEVVHNPLFDNAITHVITHDVRIFERDLPELVAEKNVIRKADMFCQTVGALADATLDCLPRVSAIVNEAIRRVSEAEGIRAAIASENR